MTEHGSAAAVEMLPVPGLPEFRPGDDLVAAIASAAPWLRDRDILVVTSKVVSKAEGQVRTAKREEAITQETDRTVARRGRTSIVRTHHGLVMAAAGVDASNTALGTVVLLPKQGQPAELRRRMVVMATALKAAHRAAATARPAVSVRGRARSTAARSSATGTRTARAGRAAAGR